jgi:cobalt/nickel transport system permease protein
VSHLHIPDGVLPPLLWIAGLAITVIVLFFVTREAAHGHGAHAPAAHFAGPRAIALQSALGGIMLVVMAVPVPITVFDYCMTLAGPVGVLLGGAAAFQVSFVVTLILALMGQGGFTVIGLNTLVLGAGAAIARPVYLRSVGALRPAGAMAAATAVSQLFSSLLWVALLWLSVRMSPSLLGDQEVAHSLHWLQGGILVGVLLPLLALAVGIESLLGYGLAGFLDRVRPDLLPRRAERASIPAEAARP